VARGVCPLPSHASRTRVAWGKCQVGPPEEVEAAIEGVERVGFGTPVWVVGMHDGASIVRLGDSLKLGGTVALLGPSGAGKSTLVNLLAETDLARTGSVREGDGKGRHTSTVRQLFKIRGGGLLLDTPGFRQLRVWELDAGLAKAFPEIDELAQGCRFRDCRHEAEPGCAVLQAAQSGRLDPARRPTSCGRLTLARRMRRSLNTSPS
jgi:ribosome biogenesis GTPase